MRISFKTFGSSIVVASLLAGASVFAATEPAQAASYDCWPRGAAIAKSNGRVVGNGSASCGSAAIPEYMQIKVKHYFKFAPDATAFYGVVKKPSSAVNWSGSVRRCDNSTKAKYYAVVTMVQWADRGSKTSPMAEVATCAGNGS